MAERMTVADLYKEMNLSIDKKTGHVKVTRKRRSKKKDKLKNENKTHFR